MSPSSVRRKRSVKQDSGPLGSAKLLKSWCRGRESNPHATFAAQDFKSFTPFLDTLQNHSINPTIREVIPEFFFRRLSRKQVMRGCSVRPVSVQGTA